MVLADLKQVNPEGVRGDAGHPAVPTREHGASKSVKQGFLRAPGQQMFIQGEGRSKALGTTEEWCPTGHRGSGQSPLHQRGKKNPSEKEQVQTAGGSQGTLGPGLQAPEWAPEESEQNCAAAPCPCAWLPGPRSVPLHHDYKRFQLHACALLIFAL